MIDWKIPISTVLEGLLGLLLGHRLVTSRKDIEHLICTWELIGLRLTYRA